MADTPEKPSVITIDVVIAKFVPILGAVLFTVGLGFLIYTSVWASMGEMMRLTVGFFVSLLIIGSAFSFPDRLRYFADVVMGWGILLLYGTLIYGSRATDVAVATIPEVATLVTACIFTIAVAYFASIRKSKVILALGMIGAYITPFVIGQNDTWVQNISYNSYLVYFAMVNVTIFFLGREMAIIDLIPLNLLGLFFGTTTLHSLSYTDGVSTVWGSGFFESENFTALILTLLVIMSVVSIALSARYFTEKKEEVMLSFGYLIPLAWLSIHFDSLASMSQWIHVITLSLVAVAYFFAWYMLRPLDENRYQHIAVYAGGVISLVFALVALFPDFNLYSSLFVAYISLVFSVIYVLDTTTVKWERILASVLFSAFGGMSALYHIYGGSVEPDYPTIMAVIALLPAMIVAPMVYIQGRTPFNVVSFTRSYSAFALVVAALIVFVKFVDFFDGGFIFFVLPGFLLLLRAYFQNPTDLDRGSHMRFATVWLSIGFFGSFFYFVANLAPGVADDEFFFKNAAIFQNMHFIKGIFAVIGYFIALSISRDIQKRQNTDRPSFLLVIIGYTSLLLMINFAIITICNDLGVALSTGGPRAIGTTIWWMTMAISMIMIGIHYGHGYRSEKLLGLILLLLTIGKIGLYDLASMDMNKKIIVLMVVGGMIMMFSYFLQVKGYLKDEAPASEKRL